MEGIAFWIVIGLLIYSMIGILAYMFLTWLVGACWKELFEETDDMDMLNDEQRVMTAKLSCLFLSVGWPYIIWLLIKGIFEGIRNSKREDL